MFHSQLPKSPYFYWLVAALLLVAAFGCNTEKQYWKAKGRVEARGNLVIPAASLDSLCALHFPVRDSLITREEVRWDTLWLLDSIDTVAVLEPRPGGYTDCPPAKTRYITKTVLKDTTVYKKDLAAIHEAQRLQTEAERRARDSIARYVGLAAQAEAKTIVTQKTSEWWRRIALIALGIIAVGIGYKLLKTRLKLPF